jgi:FdhE protein
LSPPPCKSSSPQLASQLDASHLQTLDAPMASAPAAAVLPVASVVRLGAAINNLRYLHCSLCNTEWNVPRATCTACDDRQGSRAARA